MSHTRWLPIGLTLTSNERLARWIDFGTTRIQEPFFADTVEKLLSQKPRVAEKRTQLRAVIEAAKGLTPIPAPGIIIHISRCGSTILSNALRLNEAATVLAESAQVGALLDPQMASRLTAAEGPTFHQELLDSILRLYAAQADGSNSAIVLKCHALNILYACFIRSLWPTAPIVIMIRNPVEVIVSNLRNPSPWIKAISEPSLAREYLGEPSGRQMPVEELCSRGLGAFCHCASEIAHTGCRVIDYSNLDAEAIRDLGEYLGVKLPPTHDQRFQDIMRRYSKDVSRRRIFSDDTRLKHEIASSELRQAAERWAFPAYVRLRDASGAIPVQDTCYQEPR
jgi:hypothetical protein